MFPDFHPSLASSHILPAISMVSLVLTAMMLFFSTPYTEYLLTPKNGQLTLTTLHLHLFVGLETPSPHRGC
jgi:hypothetical protein